MRIHSKGYIEASSFEVYLPPHILRSAQQTYKYLSEGFEFEVEKYLGVELEGAERFRLTRENTVLIEDDWVPPTRR